MANGMAGLKDAPGRGRKARLPADKISLIVERATRPAQGRVRWSVTHKHPAVQHWLKAHGRFHMHFTPTSFLMVKPRRAILRRTYLRSGEGSFQSLRELVRAIESYLAERNQNPKKYVWRASGLEILEKIKRARAALAAAAVIST